MKAQSSPLSSSNHHHRIHFLWLVLSLVARAHCFLAAKSSPTAGPASLWGARRYRGSSHSNAAAENYDHDHPLVYEPISRRKKGSSMTLDEYQRQYQKSIADPGDFWANVAREVLDWDVPFTESLQGNLRDANVQWFADGQLNVCFNAVDRHAAKQPDKIAMIWEGDEPTQIRRITYRQLQDRVSQIANALKSQGVRPGDVVTVYMPMVPELPMTMLACARLGAVHSVVFAGFSADALAARVVAADSKFLVTANYGMRGGRKIPLIDIVQAAEAKDKVSQVLEKVFVWDHALSSGHGDNVETTEVHTDDKHIAMDELVEQQSTESPPISRNAEDPLFILYTSGSTGQPKGLVHTTGGYAVYAAHTTQNTFQLDPELDIFACVADCGWITGHTYVVYGPLLSGGTTFLFESTPLYPNPGRYWDMVQRHRLTHFYTAPTAIRSLMQHGSEIPQQYDLTSLEILGTVGEPINPEAWRWYFEFVGRNQCTIVDTYWQTETGGHIRTCSGVTTTFHAQAESVCHHSSHSFSLAVSNVPGCTPMKPGSCTLPLFGIDAVVLDSQNGHIIDAPNSEHGLVEGVLAIRQPWPGMARTCLGDHERFQTVYLKPYPGYYFTGDAVMRDKDGYHFITGRVDDVINVSGHRIGTAELESALVLHPSVAQAAVIGTPHPIKGEAIVGFCMLDNTATESEGLIKELVQQIRSEIGAFASPDKLYIVPTLPMTRSGKIMRRILRKIVAGEADQLGDVSTLADPTIVETLIEMVET